VLVRGRVSKSVAAASVLLALAIAGCDLQENADPENGRQLFIASCGSCHILQEAGTTATIGPDLDASFANARAVGMDSDTIEGVVENQIANPRFTEPDDPTFMPADLVVGDDVTDVAHYVAQVAGVPGIEPPVAPGGPGGQVFADNGCAACHILGAAQATGTVGPDLDEVLVGMSPKEILESIVDPAANITPGFAAGVMPATYGDEISAKELDQLVEFLFGSTNAPEGSKGGGNGGGA
jgi:mono/diheme cytochrome c family protein